MAEAQNQQTSTFIGTFRLKPDRSFAGLRAKFTTKDGYELSFHDDMVWIRFDTTMDKWLGQLRVGTGALRTLLAILTIQTGYPFDIEPVQWIEDKPRDGSGAANYVLGRLGPDLTVQRDPPSVTNQHIQKGAIYAHLSIGNPYYRYALLDYSTGLSFPQEAIVFCARSVEWVETYFGSINRLLSNKAKQGKRKLMKNALKLPNKYLNRFFNIANETVIARHAKDPTIIRPPEMKEIKFCIFFNRTVLDRFGVHLWYSLSDDLPSQWKYPADEKPPHELLQTNNPEVTDILKQILRGELS